MTAGMTVLTVILMALRYDYDGHEVHEDWGLDSDCDCILHGAGRQISTTIPASNAGVILSLTRLQHVASGFGLQHHESLIAVSTSQFSKPAPESLQEPAPQVSP